MPLFCSANTNFAAMALARGTGYAVSNEVANLFVATWMPHLSYLCLLDTPAHMRLIALNYSMLKASKVRFGRLLPYMQE